MIVRRRNRWASNRGIALVIVLWALTIIAVIAANFTTANRDGLFLARNTVERAKAEALADAGIYRAALAIVNQEAEPQIGEAAETAGQLGGLASSLQSVRSGFGNSQDLGTSEEQFGEFGPPWPDSAPSAGIFALRFLGPPAGSTSNDLDYAMTTEAAIFRNNANDIFTVTSPTSVALSDLSVMSVKTLTMPPPVMGVRMVSRIRPPDPE